MVILLPYTLEIIQVPGHKSHSEIHARQFPSEGIHGFAPWSEFSAEPEGLSDIEMLSNNY